VVVLRPPFAGTERTGENAEDEQHHEPQAALDHGEEAAEANEQPWDSGDLGPVTESIAWLIRIAGIRSLAIQGICQPWQQAEGFGWAIEDGKAVRAFEASDWQQGFDPCQSAELLGQQAIFTEGASVVSTGAGNGSPRCSITHVNRKQTGGGPENRPWGK